MWVNFIKKYQNLVISKSGEKSQNKIVVAEKMIKFLAKLAKGGWVDEWMDGSTSSFKDCCLQETKM